MSKILELTEKRAKAWETAKAFLDAKRNADGFVSAEDAATYEKAGTGNKYTDYHAAECTDGNGKCKAV